MTMVAVSPSPLTTPSRSLLALVLNIPGDAGQRMAFIIPETWALIVQQAIGVAHQLLAKLDCVPDCTISLLECYLDHYGPHSDRVWPSEEAQEIWLQERLPQGKNSERSRDRAKQKLALIGVLKVGVQAEALAGPGPHHYPKEKLRCKDGVVPIIDLGGFLAKLPKPFLDMLSAERSKLSLPIPPNTPPPIKSSPLPVDLDRLYSAPNPPPLSNVTIEEGSLKKVESLSSGEAADFYAPNLAHRTEVSDRISRDSGMLPAAAPETAKAAKVEREKALAAWVVMEVPTVYFGRALTWIQSFGETWVWELIAYGRWQSRRSEVRGKLGSYLDGIFKAWVAEKEQGIRSAWPDEFLLECKREKANRARVEATQEAKPIATILPIQGNSPVTITPSTMPAIAGKNTLQRIHEFTFKPPTSPCELDCVWSHFLRVCSRSLARRTFGMFVQNGLYPAAWNAASRTATFLCATQPGYSELQKPHILLALSEALREALKLPKEQTVRVILIDNVNQ